MSVGEALARAREERGLSVDDVSQVTRIRATLVREIEADTFEHCGGAFYARGHIRSIAQTVGADPRPLLEEFDREHGTEAVSQPVLAHDPVAARAEPRRPNWLAAMIVVLVVICALAAARLATGSGGSTGHNAAAPPSPSPAVSSAAPAPSATHSAPAPLVAAVPADKVTMLVRVLHAQTWLSVTGSNGQTDFQGLLAAGQSKLFEDPRTLSVVIGNAPVVDLVVNNHDLGSPQSQGNVARLSFSRGEFAAAGG